MEEEPGSNRADKYCIYLAVVDPDLHAVTEVFRQKLASHLLEISFSKKAPNLSYHKVGDILFDVPGISDVSDFTINNGHETISGEFDEFFALEEVELSAS